MARLTKKQLSVMLSRHYGLDVPEKSINSALVMANFIKWEDKYILLNKKLGKWDKAPDAQYPEIFWADSLLEDKTFMDIMDAKFKEKKEEIKPVIEKDIEMITPTKIGNHFGIEAKVVNQILIDLKLQKLTEKGYFLLKKDGKTTLKTPMGIVNNSYEKASIKWNPSILHNPALIKAVKGISSKPKTLASTKPVVKKPKSVYIEIDREKWVNDWHIELGRLQAVGTDAEIQSHMKKKPVSFRTERGDIVPSKNEVILANALLKAGAPYVCGEVVKGIEEVIVSDFYLPYRYLHNGEIKKLDLWCEYWGDMGVSYEKNKKRKRDLAKKYGFNLVEFPASTSEDMATRLERILDNHPAVKATGLSFRELNKAHSELTQMLY